MAIRSRRALSDMLPSSQRRDADDSGTDWQTVQTSDSLTTMSSPRPHNDQGRAIHYSSYRSSPPHFIDRADVQNIDNARLRDACWERIDVRHQEMREARLQTPRDLDLGQVPGQSAARPRRTSSAASTMSKVWTTASLSGRRTASMASAAVAKAAGTLARSISDGSKAVARKLLSPASKQIEKAKISKPSPYSFSARVHAEPTSPDDSQQLLRRKRRAALVPREEPRIAALGEIPRLRRRRRELDLRWQDELNLPGGKDDLQEVMAAEARHAQQRRSPRRSPTRKHFSVYVDDYIDDSTVAAVAAGQAIDRSHDISEAIPGMIRLHQGRTASRYGPAVLSSAQENLRASVRKDTGEEMVFF